MNSFRKYLTQSLVEGEEQLMEIDHNFTERYLSDFPSIDRQTVDVLIDNGYENRDSLLALDINVDLPLIPVLNMGQKSLLRKALIQLHECHDFETKVNDIKGNDSFEAVVNTSSGLNAYKSEDSPKRWPKKRKNNDSEPIYVSTHAVKEESSSDSSHEAMEETSRRGTSRRSSNWTGRTTRNGKTNSPVVTYVPTPTDLQFTKGCPPNRRISTLTPTETKAKTPNVRTSRLSTPPQPKTESPKTRYVPTPTEIEVRERLALKRSQTKPKRGTKRQF